MSGRCYQADTTLLQIENIQSYVKLKSGRQRTQPIAGDYTITILENPSNTSAIYEEANKMILLNPYLFCLNTDSQIVYIKIKVQFIDHRVKSNLPNIVKTTLSKELV